MTVKASARGGVRTGVDMMSTVEGLYTAGEIQGGVHGANRLGGNALTHVLAFGRAAGREAAGYAARTSGAAPSDAKVEAEHRRIFGWMDGGGKGESPVRLRQQMQVIMLPNEPFPLFDVLQTVPSCGAHNGKSVCDADTTNSCNWVSVMEDCVPISP